MVDCGASARQEKSDFRNERKDTLYINGDCAYEFSVCEVICVFKWLCKVSHFFVSIWKIVFL